MKSNLRCILLTLVFLVSVTSYGCSKLPVDKVKPGADTTGSTKLIQRSNGISEVQFYFPDGPSDDNKSRYGPGYPFFAEVGNAVLMFRILNGAWPQSWSDLTSGYLPLLPADKIDNKPYILANLEDYRTTAPVNVVLASWSEDGPEIHMADVVRGKIQNIEFGRDKFNRALPELTEVANRE